MKTFIAPAAVSLAVLLFGFAAQANEYCGPDLWPAVKNMARECASERASGRNCPEMRVYAGGSAEFYLGRDLYRVRMEESINADGGDLNDVYIVRQDGCRLARRNVAAYGDIITALAR